MCELKKCKFLNMIFTVLLLFAALQTHAAAGTWVAEIAESSHPLGKNTQKEYLIRNLAASTMVVHFDHLELPSGSTLHVLDNYGTPITKYTNTGDLYNVNTPVIPGNTAILQLDTDASATGYGFLVDGYTYEALNPAVPTLILEQVFPATKPDNHIGDNIIFHENGLYLVTQKRFPRSFLTDYVQHWQFIGEELVYQSEVDMYGVSVASPNKISVNTIGMLGDNVLAADDGNIYDTVTGNYAALKFNTDPNQIATDSRGVIYVGNPVQIVNTDSLDGSWEVIGPTPSISFPVQNMYADDQYLVLNRGNLSIPVTDGEIAVYDVQDPNFPVLLAEINLPNGAKITSWKPVVIGDYLYVPFDKRIVSYHLPTGNVTGYIDLPSDVMLKDAYDVERRFIYAGGTNKIYIIDTANPASMVLQDTITVTRNPVSAKISRVHVHANRLYVVVDGVDSLAAPQRYIRTIALPDNYPLEL